MTDERSEHNEVPFTLITALVLGAIVIAMLYMWIGTIGTSLQDSFNLKDSPCQSVVVIDKFSNLRGGISPYTQYYIIHENKTPYWLYNGGNITQVYLWNTLEKGKSYDIKLYKDYAEFC